MKTKKKPVILIIAFIFGVTIAYAVSSDSSANNSGFEIEVPVKEQSQKSIDTNNVSLSKQKDLPAKTQKASAASGKLLITQSSDTVTQAQSDSAQNALSPVEKLPEFKEFKKAQYPARELKEGIEGTVLLELIITDSGHVTAVTVLKGVTPVLDSAAKNAVEKFKFTPAIAGGKPVSVMIQYAYRFSVLEEVNQVQEYANLKGILKEKKTGSPIQDGIIVASFPDTNSDTSLTVPWNVFLKKIGSFSGQYLEQGKLVTMSDSLGQFAFKTLPAGKVKLTFLIGGYVVDTVSEEMEKGIQLKMEYRLKKPKNNEYEIIVYGKMERVKNISQISISPAQISKLPSLGEADICRSLQLLPGISGSNESSAGLYVRGGTPDQNLILFDDFNVYHVDHFYGFFSAFNPQAVKDIEMYKGGFDARYGGRISSVMELTGKTGDTSDLKYGGGLSLLSANAFLEVPLWKKGSLLFVGRRSYTDFIKFGIYDKIFSLFQNSNQTTGVPGPGGGNGRFNSMSVQPSFYYYDYNSKITYDITDKDVLSASFYNSKDNLDNSRESSMNMRPPGSSDQSNVSMNTKDYTGWGSLGTSIKWARQWADRFYSHTVLAYANYFSNRDRSMETKIEETMQNANALSEDNNVLDITLKQDNGWRLNQNNKIEFGGQISRIYITYKNTQNDSTSIMNANDTALQAAAYLQDNLTLFSDRLSLTPGLRFSYFEKTHSYYPEPRASVSYKIADPIKIKAAVGKYYQFINRVTREDVLSGSSNFWLLADDKAISVSSADHYIAGISYETPLFLFDVEAYQKNMKGLTEFTMRYGPPRPSGESADNLFYQGTGIAKGVEFLLQKKAGIYNGWVGYTLGEVTHTFPDLNNGNSFPALHDQTHELKIVNMLSLGEWDFSGTWVYATGKPYSAPVGEYDVHLLDGSTYRYIHVGDKNAFRLPDYHKLDLSVKYNFTMSTIAKADGTFCDKYKGDVGISLFNVYNRTNVWYKEFDFVEGEVVETNVNYIGFMPTLFVNISIK
jgi:TonB family protein